MNPSVVNGTVAVYFKQPVQLFDLIMMSKSEVEYYLFTSLDGINFDVVKDSDDDDLVSGFCDSIKELDHGI